MFKYMIFQRRQKVLLWSKELKQSLVDKSKTDFLDNKIL